MVPGPGSYVHKEILGNHGPKYQIGGKNNYSPIQKEIEKVPGPGNYQPSWDATK